MTHSYEIHRFYEWIKLKIKLDKIHRTSRIKEGEIWWAAVGKNVGVEINGKHKAFARPVIIFRKLGYMGFLAIPTTTKIHDGSWYVSIHINAKTTRAVLSQIRIMSTSRLYKKMGRISEQDMDNVRAGFEKLYLNKK